MSGVVPRAQARSHAENTFTSPLNVAPSHFFAVLLIVLLSLIYRLHCIIMIQSIGVGCGTLPLGGTEGWHRHSESG